MNILKSKHFKTLLISVFAIAALTVGVLWWNNNDVAVAGWWPSFAKATEGKNDNWS